MVAFAAREISVTAVTRTLSGGLIAYRVPGADLVTLASCEKKKFAMVEKLKIVIV